MDGERRSRRFLTFTGDFADIAASGLIAVARPLKGISPKTALRPLAGPRAFGDELTSEGFRPDGGIGESNVQSRIV